MPSVGGVSLDDVRREIQGLGGPDGLSPGKIEESALMSLAQAPGDWATEEVAQALCDLVADAARKLRNEKERAAAAAAMMLDELGVQRRPAKARWRARAVDVGLHPDTLRKTWWPRAVDTLAEAVPGRVRQVNETPSGWEQYRSTGVASQREVEASADHHMETVDVAWLLRGRVLSELLTYRTLVAHRDGLSSYQARAWYFNDPDPDKYEIVPLMNCALGRLRRAGNRGLLLADLEFPEPLRRDDRVFFAYKILIHSEKDAEPVVRHEVRSERVDSLVFRVQFDTTALPTSIWHFSGSDDADPYQRPSEGSPRYIQPTRLGYVQAAWQAARRGRMYGITWSWGRSDMEG